MNQFEWKPAFSVQNRKLDEQHKSLIGLMQGFYAAHLDHDKPRAHRELAALLTLTVQHFRLEEEMMQKAGYPDFANHKKGHEELLGQVEKLAKDYLNTDSHESAGKLANFLKAWLVRHILGSDKQYAPYLGDAVKR